MPSSTATSPSTPRSSEPVAADPAIVCDGVVKRFYRYEHRTSSLREFFIRSVLRRPIHVRHAEFTLRDFNLRVFPGERVALIGPNGSGKSTALRLIAGIYSPSEGTIECRGRIAAVIDLMVGFHPELTGLENLELYGSVMGLTRRELALYRPDILAFADIGDFIDEPLKYYSSGMQARLAFAVTVSIRPDILLLDEVLAVGDKAFRQRCNDRLREFVDGGGTLIVVSHEFDVLRKLCTRAVWLEGGRVRMDGPLPEVVEAYQASPARRA
jgi:ABC-type polysaccharide/polyol phosphate transport system ATPase subunit